MLESLSASAHESLENKKKNILHVI